MVILTYVAGQRGLWRTAVRGCRLRCLIGRVELCFSVIWRGCCCKVMCRSISDNKNMDELIRYRRPSDEQLENLRAITRMGERSDPIVFAGRDGILQEIPAIIQDKRLNPELNSISQIIQGAPGAGKISLLNELERTNQGDHVSVVRLDGEDLSEPLRVAERFMSGARADVSDISEVKTRSRRTTGDLKVVQQEEGWESRKSSALDRISQGASIWHTIKPLLGIDDDHVFLLLVDEAQRVEKTTGKSVNEVVTSLHSGGEATAGIKILPVFAGLSDTAEQLIDVGLSRQAARPHHLGALTLAEAHYAAEGFLRDQNLGLGQVFSQSDRSELARTLAVASEGWPRHLHHYLTGSAQEIVDDCGSPAPIGGVSLPAILEHGDEARYDYYIDRLRGARINEVSTALQALALAMGFAITHLKGDDIEQYVAGHYTDRHIDVSDQINRAIHAGVLEPRPDFGVGYFGYPIPSFSTFMACRGEREATLKNLRCLFMQDLAIWQVNLTQTNPQVSTGTSVK